MPLLVSAPPHNPTGRAVKLGLALGLIGLIASLLPVAFVLDEVLGLGALFTARGSVARRAGRRLVCRGGGAGRQCAALGGDRR